MWSIVAVETIDPISRRIDFGGNTSCPRAFSSVWLATLTFFQTLIAGGAQYRATGRGFVTRHAHFDENWRFFSSSHIYLGIELLGALAVFGLNTKTRQFWGHGWSMFVAAMSFVWTPYWFNPLAFNWSSVSKMVKLDFNLTNSACFLKIFAPIE